MAGVSRVRELLAQAVQCLDNSTATQGNNQTGSGPQSVSLTSRSSLTSSRLSVLAEHNCLFNFGERGKGNAESRGGTRKSKKKRVAMWNHDFICLARVDQERTPTSIERSKLISAGMVECLAGGGEPYYSLA